MSLYIYIYVYFTYDFPPSWRLLTAWGLQVGCGDPVARLQVGPLTGLWVWVKAGLPNPPETNQGCSFLPKPLASPVFFYYIFSPPDRKGLLDFMLESAFAMLLQHAPTQYPARQSSSPVGPAECQSSSPVDPAEYPARAARH